MLEICVKTIEYIKKLIYSVEIRLNNKQDIKTYNKLSKSHKVVPI